MKTSHRLNGFKLWVCAIGMVISGQYFGWNYCFSYANLSDILLSLSVVFLFYSLLMVIYVKLALAIPQAGGIMAYIQAIKKPRTAKVIGAIAFFEFFFAVAAISVALGSYIHQLIPSVSPQQISLLTLASLGILNKAGLEQSIKLEILVTCLALFGVGLFILTSLHYQEINFITHHMTAPNTQHIFMAIPFVLWLFLGIEGTVLAAKPQEDYHPILSSTVKKAMITLGVSALLLVIQVATLIQPHEWKTNSLLPTVIQHQHTTLHWVVITLSICGSCGLLASLNGLLIAAIEQWRALTNQKNSVIGIVIAAMMICMIFKTPTLLILSVTCALIIYLSVALCYWLLKRNTIKASHSHPLISIITFSLGSFLCFCIVYSKFH